MSAQHRPVCQGSSLCSDKTETPLDGTHSIAVHGRYHPSYLGRCAIGWAILDKDDPTKIIAREHSRLTLSESFAPRLIRIALLTAGSTDALMVATLPFETCGGEKNKGPSCQEPLVLFSTGVKPLGNDEFYVIYGSADTDVGVARIKVNVH